MTVGLNLTALEYDTLACQHIRPDLLQLEAGLYQTKWWDYRIMHPMEATYHFAQAYVQAVKAAVRKRIDLYVSINCKPLKDQDFLKCSRHVITGLWKARQEADRHGIPYDFWCSKAMKYAQDRDWRYLPKPTHLYQAKPMFEDDISMVEFIKLSWQEKNAHSIPYAESDFYRIERFCGNKHQKEHQSYLLRRIGERANKVYPIATFVFEKQLLFPATITMKFGKKTGTSLLKRAELFSQ